MSLAWYLGCWRQQNVIPYWTRSLWPSWARHCRLLGCSVSASVFLVETAAGGRDGTLKHYVLPVGTMVFSCCHGMMRLYGQVCWICDSEYIKLARIKDYRQENYLETCFEKCSHSSSDIGGMLFAPDYRCCYHRNIFSWPGMRRLAVEAVQARLPVVQAITIIVAIWCLA